MMKIQKHSRQLSKSIHFICLLEIAIHTVDSKNSFVTLHIFGGNLHTDVNMYRCSTVASDMKIRRVNAEQLEPTAAHFHIKKPPKNVCEYVYACVVFLFYIYVSELLICSIFSV